MWKALHTTVLGRAMVELGQQRDALMRDMCSSSGAQALATTIRGYWRERGYDVAVDVMPMTASGIGDFVVRSDLRNGWPRRPAPSPKTRVLDQTRPAAAALLEAAFPV